MSMPETVSNDRFFAIFNNATTGVDQDVDSFFIGSNLEGGHFGFKDRHRPGYLAYVVF